MRPDVVCLGILVADVIARPVDRIPRRGSIGLVEELALRGGGCALNTSTVLARLGIETAVVGKVGCDPLGEFLLQLLDERGLDRRGVLQDSRYPTSASVALVDSDGERTFLHLPGSNAQLREDELPTTIVYCGRVLHVAGSLVMGALDGEPLGRVLAGARERGLVTSLDVVWDASDHWKRVMPALPHLDLFAPTLAEARAITGQHTPKDVVAWLQDRGVREVALKMGPQGCYAAGDDFEGAVEPLSVQPIDGTGAGDAFVAGLLYGKLAGWPFGEAVRFANATGALATTAVGAAEGVGSLSQVMQFANPR